MRRFLVPLTVMLATLPTPSGLRGQALDDLPLQRPVSLHLSRVRLAAALDTVEHAAHLHLVYDPATVPVSRRVSIDTIRVPAVNALRFLLRGTSIEVVPRPGNEVLLIRPSPVSRPASADTGSVTGTVIDATGNAPILDALLTLTDAGGATPRQVRTTIDGRYTIRGVDVGTYTLTARALGHTPVTARAVIVAGSTARVDFALPAAPEVLDRVVTTATGDQQVRALGNTIATISVADSVTGRAPITNLSDVISARASGVQVFLNGGLTAASPAINIRGQNSANLSNQPLLVIDGLRVDNGASADLPLRDLSSGFSVGETAGRFNDLIPEEIESIEIVKGPSAATLYGTDAANGVIVVTTRHGQVGAPRWTTYAENGELTLDQNKFPENMRPWGHTLDGTNSPITCSLELVGEGVCAQDSVTQFTPLRDPSFTPIGTGHRYNYGAQVTGGSAVTRYFLSGALESETGYLKMPQADLSALRIARGAIGVSSDEVRPNGVDKADARTNLTSSLGRTVELATSASVLAQSSRIPSAVSLASGDGGQGFPGEPNEGWGAQSRPSQFFEIRNREDVTHFVGSLAPTWRPAGWLVAQATTGIDYSSTMLDHLERPGEGLADPLGLRVNARTNSATYTADANATGTASLNSALTSRTSVGVQYTHRASLLTSAMGSGLSPGAVTVAGAATQTSNENTTESVIGGGYVEQTVSAHDRLFLTGALRVDGASSFGTGFRTAVYPKASASWIVSEEPFWPRSSAVSSVRLRAAFGASGVQPPSGATIQQEALIQAFVDGAPTTGTNLSLLGNPHLRPERQRELELGPDIDLWGQRVHVEATYYNKRSSDALVAISLPSSLGSALGQFVNIGSVSNVGYEGLVHVTLLDTRRLGADLTVNGSINHNKLVSLGAGAITADEAAGAGVAQFVLGAPLGSYFDRPIVKVVDSNHDGIVEPNEITLGDPTFEGQSFPKTQLTTMGGLSLLNHSLRFGVQFDYRGGFTLLDNALDSRCSAGSCPDAFRPGTPLGRQAPTVVAQNFSEFLFSRAGFYEDGSFTRLRELSLTWTVPQTLTRRLRARDLSLMLAARNLAIWTHYRGVDPEVTSVLNGGLATGFSGAYYDLGSPIPPPTYWIARVTIGL